MKKIVVIGPESTGKSSLCDQLARHYNTLWCPEYAREYLLTHGMNYSYDDLLTIAKGQVALEEKYVQLAIDNRQLAKGKGQDGKTEVHSPFTIHYSLLFIDTDMYVMKVWCEFVFGKCHQWILDKIKKRKYNLYLLCNIDLPWVPDELREYPDLESRKKLYQIYKEILQNQSTPWVEISGSPEQRVATSMSAVDNLLKNNLDYFRRQ